MWLNQSEQHRPIVQSKRTSKILLHVHINGVFEKEKFNAELFKKKTTTTTKRHITIMVFCWGTAWPAADRGLYRKKIIKWVPRMKIPLFFLRGMLLYKLRSLKKKNQSAIILGPIDIEDIYAFWKTKLFRVWSK